MHISHEAIYRAIYLRKSHAVLPKGIYHCLRCCRPIRYGKYYFTRGQWRSQIKNAQSIDQCPTEANNRLIPGHWEGDLVLGTNFSQVATLVDRCTKEVHIIQLANVSGCLCVGVGFLEVFVEVVWVGDSHLVDGLFPSGDFFALDKAAS